MTPRSTYACIFFICNKKMHIPPIFYLEKNQWSNRCYKYCRRLLQHAASGPATESQESHFIFMVEGVRRADWQRRWRICCQSKKQKHLFVNMSAFISVVTENLITLMRELIRMIYYTFEVNWSLFPRNRKLGTVVQFGALTIFRDGAFFKMPCM